MASKGMTKEENKRKNDRRAICSVALRNMHEKASSVVCLFTFDNGLKNTHFVVIMEPKNFETC